MPENGAACEWSAVEINIEEVEALRLKNIVGLDQTKAAAEMKISQSSLQRLLSSAYKKITEALIEGKPIKVIGVDNK
jgi:uncharacterized protein